MKCEHTQDAVTIFSSLNLFTFLKKTFQTKHLAVVFQPKDKKYTWLQQISKTIPTLCTYTKRKGCGILSPQKKKHNTTLDKEPRFTWTAQSPELMEEVDIQRIFLKITPIIKYNKDYHSRFTARWKGTKTTGWK